MTKTIGFIPSLFLSLEVNMTDFEIIDTHAHLTRNIEEEENYFLFPGRRRCDRYATPERAIEYMDNACVSKMVFLTLIPRQFRGPLVEKTKIQNLPENERRAKEKEIGNQIGPIMREMNEWGCTTAKRFPRLLPFSCISKELGEADDIANEVELRASQGAKGIKMHPGMFVFSPDDDELWPAYEKCQKLGLPIIADSGPWPVSHVLVRYPTPVFEASTASNVDYGEPINWIRVLEAFPKLESVDQRTGNRHCARGLS